MHAPTPTRWASSATSRARARCPSKRTRRPMYSQNRSRSPLRHSPVLHRWSRDVSHRRSTAVSRRTRPIVRMGRPRWRSSSATRWSSAGSCPSHCAPSSSMTRGSSAFERFLRWISGVGLGVAVFALAGFAASDPPNYPLMITLMWSLTAGVASGIGALVMLQRRRDVDAEFWGRLWTGRVGRWLFGVARMFTGTKVLPASLTHRPTELALGMAAEQLYETLPKETRRQLRDLPDVVHRLEQDAQRMRARLEELQEALSDVGHSGNPDPAIAARHDRIVADLSAERDLVQQRLKDAVAALETIRLNLLRLHAGTGSVRNLTTDLGLARELARDIDAHVDGLREVEDAL